jgi:eukaryotic-like serine/threonine-protein kinase
MSTPTPARLGPYELIAPIGKGGMGEVWRARDPRLGRDVAIKISSQQFTNRFETEARAIAALNHPNICTLFDVGPDYLVMEMVEGPTLAERIAQGPVPREEALNIARQIADALDAAHEKGIVHRDLKPANIKLRSDGSVKVLDFGLAKPAASPPALGDDSPTMLLSAVGVILGTAGYMSPEQARGQQVDKRADIWAFGVVLYEMLTGERLFEGATISDVLAAVIKDSPDLGAAPARVRKLLSKCLQKDPKKRLRDIGDWADLLEERSLTVAAPKGGASMVAPWIAAAAFAVLAAALAFVHFREKPPEVRVERFSLLTPEKADLSSPYSLPAISPDGRRVAIAPRIDGQYALWVRDLDGLAFRMLPGTEGANYPFWSPDSRWFGFFAGGKLKKIEVTGGSAITLCDAPSPRGGSCSREDITVFAVFGVGLYRMPAAGGTPILLTKIDTAGGEVTHRTPWFLPDGRQFLYTARHNDDQDTRIYIDTIDTKPGSNTRREVVVGAANAVYLPGSRRAGWLLFMRDSTLVAHPFDDATAKTSGDAVPNCGKRRLYGRGYSAGPIFRIG